MTYQAARAFPPNFLNGIGPGIRAGGIILAFLTNLAYYRDFMASREWREHPETEIFDFIVGGGSAGAAVSSRLSRHNSVLLLEIGGTPNSIFDIPIAGLALGPQEIPHLSFLYKTVPQNNTALSFEDRAVPLPRGKGLGGSSNINGMVYQRGNPQDYDAWADITGDPIWKYENVLPFFKNMEDYDGYYPDDKYHSKGGPWRVEKLGKPFMADYFLRAAKEKGYYVGDLNGYQKEGFSHMEVNMNGGTRVSTYTAYLKPILKRRNLKIYRYSQVIKIHLSKDRRQAYGVTYLRHGQKRFVRAKNEIIISAGVIDSVKLLQLSGIGPRKVLHSVGLKCRVNLPVGRNLQDHIAINLGPYLVDTEESVNVERLLRPKHKNLADYSGLFGLSGLTGIGFVSTSVRNDTSWPDIQYNLVPLGASSTMSKLMKASRFEVLGDLMEKYLEGFSGHDANYIFQILVRPKSRGYIQIASKDPFAPPIIQPNYLQHKDDVKALVEGARIMTDIFETTKTYKRINARLIPNHFPGCEKFKLRSDAYYECFVRYLCGSEQHPVGTVPMGKKHDPKAVVDSHLRVLKTRGLRVIDASVMPLLVNSNPNTPTIMIAEVGSYLIRGHWAKQYLVCPKYSRLLSPEDLNTKCFYSRAT